MDSTIQLAKTIDDDSPSMYAFYKPIKERNFRVDYGLNSNEMSIVLFDRTNERNYEMCYLRGIFKSKSELAKTIIKWIEEEIEIQELTKQQSNLERFEYDTYINPNDQIEKKWQYVKNSIFNDTKFWKNRNYELRYNEMLKMAKRKKEWSNYYPFTSHHLLRFSLNPETTHTWVLGLHIAPTRNKDKGKYFVGVPTDDGKEDHYFDELTNAIEFYESKLNEHKPILWK